MVGKGSQEHHELFEYWFRLILLNINKAYILNAVLKSLYYYFKNNIYIHTYICNTILTT